MKTDLENNYIECLKKYQPSLLLRSYVHILIDSLYIEVDNENQGIANEMIKYGHVTNYPFETTLSVISFFKDEDELIRGKLHTLNNQLLDHAWIKFKFNNRTYIFDPDINLLIPETIYYRAFKPQELSKIKAKQIKNDILKILNSKPNKDNWHDIESSSSINDSFYKINMSIKGENIKRKILTLTTHYHNN
jgi:hypothetical protein